MCELIGRVDADPDVLPRTENFGVDYIAFSAMCPTCPPEFLKMAYNCVKVSIRTIFRSFDKREDCEKFEAYRFIYIFKVFLNKCITSSAQCGKFKILVTQIFGEITFGECQRSKMSFLPF